MAVTSYVKTAATTRVSSLTQQPAVSHKNPYHPRRPHLLGTTLAAFTQVHHAPTTAVISLPLLSTTMSPPPYHTDNNSQVHPDSPPTLRVAYQGEPGAYSEQAAQEYFTRTTNNLTLQPHSTFQSVFESLHEGLVDRAAVPIENSVAGTIHENLDLLLRYRDLTIVGELDFHVRHCLLALEGTKLTDISVVRSHPMALAQCKEFLRRNFLMPETAYDTAGSAKRIWKDKLEGVAAIAGTRAAEIYDLAILAEDIQDDDTNYTRFLILSKTAEPYYPGTPCKTSLAFSLVNGPGTLCRALSVFAVTAIDLTKIESRHIRCVTKALTEAGENVHQSVENRWGFVFYVDIARHIEEKAVTSALNHLQEITEFYRVLGSYPAHSANAKD